MSITIVIVSTALASSFGASLAMFVFQKYYDRRLEYYFNSRLEEMKAGLNHQGDVNSQIISRRLEIYPHLTELIYRIRNKLKEMCQLQPLTLEQVVEFLRLAEEYTEQIYSVRLDLERDELFGSLHGFKGSVLITKNILLDWIYLTRDKSSKNTKKANLSVSKLRENYTHIDRQHRRLIRSLTKLTQT